MTDRRRCYARQPPVAGLVLTTRDVEILMACYSCQWLTRAQLQRRFQIPGVTRINQRLRQLYDHCYLQRLQVGTVSCGLQPIYLTGEAAIPLLVERTEQTPKEISSHIQSDLQASAVLLPHDLEVNEVRISLELGAESCDDVLLERWLNARQSFDAFTKGRSLRPDGFFILNRNDVVSPFFLEVDRGTVSLPNWRAKVQRYLDYLETGAYSRRYGLQRFRVLVTGSTPARLHHLKSVTEEVTDRRFWFSLTKDVINEPTSTHLWTAIGSAEKRSLFSS